MKNWIFRVIGEGIEPTNEQIAKFVEDFSNYTVDVGDVPTAILERIKRPYTPEDIKTTIKQIVIKYFDVTIKKVLCVKAEEESIRSFLYDFLRVSMRLFVREFVDSVAAYFVGGVDDLKKTLQYFLYMSFKNNHKEANNNSHTNFICFNFSELVVQNLLNAYYRSCAEDPTFSFNFEELMRGIYEEEAKKDDADDDNVFSINGSGLRFRFKKKDVATLMEKWKGTIAYDMEKVAATEQGFCFTDNYKRSLNYI